MKKLTENLGVKITAIFLSFIAFAAVLSSVITIIFLLDNDCYTKTRDERQTDIMENRRTSAAYNRRTAGRNTRFKMGQGGLEQQSDIHLQQSSVLC